MADIDQPFYSPMDQAYHNNIQRNVARSDVEESIFPISLVGQTVPEFDASGRHRNIIEGIDAAFRGGAGNIQLVMMGTGHFDASMGQVPGPAGYGEEVRESIRELQKVSGGRITGVELPTKINNLTGFTQQGFSEEQRKTALDEVKDAIKFVGDISGGGGVDIVSFEFPRDMRDSRWYAEEERKGFKFEPKEKGTATVVDKNTGHIEGFRKDENYYLYYDKGALEKGRLVELKENEKPEKFNWKEIEQVAKLQVDKNGNHQYYDSKTGRVDAGKFLYDEYHIRKQKEQLEGNIAYYDQIIHQEDSQIEQIRHMISEAKSGEQLKNLRANIEHVQEALNNPEMKSNPSASIPLQMELQKLMKAEHELSNIDISELNKGLASIEGRRKTLFNSIRTIKQQEAQLDDQEKRYVPVDKFGIGKATESYAEAGIFAMQESLKNQYVQEGKGEIHVGPEMGWPQYYGSHPKEWVELILKSREEMVEKLTTPGTGYYQEGVSKHEAEELAKKHIKGELDTAHLGMWLQNFRPELPWGERVSKFKDWYKDQMEYLAEQNKKYDVIGGIQVVDSASGAHGVLPPGQGVLGKDLFEYMKILKEKGNYKGDLTSEGFGEERFGQGRILSRSWETFNSPISGGYWNGRPMPQFRDIRNSYAQIAYGTTGIFQSYVPSNDFTLWSQVPLE